jgi:hypothetical protein
MVDDTSAAAGSGASVCPWCSATYTGDPEACPSCGAALTVDPATDPSLPGVTAIDPAAIVRAKAPVARPRSRLLSWISGDYIDDGLSPAEAGALAPPDDAVRREMLRLALQAEVADLQAEADAIRADEAMEGRAPATGPDEGAAAETVPQAGVVAEGRQEVDAVHDAEARTDEDRQAV